MTRPLRVGTIVIHVENGGPVSGPWRIIDIDKLGNAYLEAPMAPGLTKQCPITEVRFWS